MIPKDTSKDAYLKQIEVLRKIGPQRRAEMVIELSDNLRSIVEAGIRNRHPEYTDQQVVQAVLSLVVDKENDKKSLRQHGYNPISY
ncbi:hypothetical protein SMSP2_00607 [Limihaloglobus sulfuriphilus]|uniref:Uncharacterized protein n=1 Tax=Limihaloglobus sulfuriphilus TaxID=1851148 RepID=A0A1Q2MC22_9BACT|nr:hypothetical protein [Limihaloglobus sulfuriphilus]AQQ70263.1 hypothetical protein SMSP2_00607 [Limihaloglobus sulfuriphilus]